MENYGLISGKSDCQVANSPCHTEGSSDSQQKTVMDKSSLHFEFGVRTGGAKKL